MKTEKGVMIMKDGKAWGVVYKDSQCTSEGWIDPDDAPIHNPESCKKPTDATYKGSIDFDELLKGELVSVVRKTTVEIVK